MPIDPQTLSLAQRILELESCNWSGTLAGARIPELARAVVSANAEFQKSHVSIPEELGNHLVGLWKFRQVARRPTWCTTFMIDGAFYDTTGAKTPQAAIDKALKELRKARRKSK